MFIGYIRTYIVKVLKNISEFISIDIQKIKRKTCGIDYIEWGVGYRVRKKINFETKNVCIYRNVTRYNRGSWLKYFIRLNDIDIFRFGFLGKIK